MHYTPFLKTGSKKNNNTYLFFLFSFSLLVLSPLTGDESAECVYNTSDEGALVLSYTPGSVPEDKILNNIRQGHRSEIHITYRIQKNTGKYPLMGGEHLELNIRRTGFRDKITGDYVLMLNDRELAVFREWAAFFENFSSPIVYSSRIILNGDVNLQIKVRSRIIFKKLVPPFSIMYIIPGKFMHSQPWQLAKREDEL